MTRGLEWKCLSEAIESSRTAISKKISATSKETTDKKGFSKLDKSNHKQSLNASVPNEEIAAAEPSETCKNFFKKSSYGNATLNFKQTMKQK